MTDIPARIAGLDWPRIAADIDRWGAATTGPLLSAGECRALVALYPQDSRFRSTVTMARHGFGRGEYRYFGYPLPDPVAALRAALYPRLAAVANDWADRTGDGRRYPGRLDEWLAECHAAGQTRPTPLLLQYRPGDYNCLHQDLYGEHLFPLQAAFLLSVPRVDFSGGEFVLTEQRPRQQSRIEVVDLRRGEAVIFPVNRRPLQGSRGIYRTAMRHGVSRLKSGERHTLGIILHDAA